MNYRPSSWRDDRASAWLLRGIVAAFFCFPSAGADAEPRVIVGGSHSDPEPNLSIDLNNGGPIVIYGGLDADAELELTFSKNNIDAVKYEIIEGKLIEAVPLEPSDSGFRFKVRVKDGIGAGEEQADPQETARVRIWASGRNGRKNWRDLVVFVNGGGIRGEIKPRVEQPDPATMLEIEASTPSSRFEGTVLYIDRDSNGKYEPHDPVSLVDAANQFYFLKQELFHREHLVRPLKLVVEGTRVADQSALSPVEFESQVAKYLVGTGQSWFQIERLTSPDNITAVGEAAESEPVATMVPASSDNDSIDTDVAAVEDAVAEAEDAVEMTRRIFVNAAKTPSGTGSSWQDAVSSLADALGQVTSLDPQPSENAPVEIWVADGLYLPNTAVGYSIPAHVHIYGGFRGTEELLSERPALRRSTILSGDILKNDGHSAPLTGIAASPDGKLFATAAEDFTIKIWRTDRALVATLRGHRQRVNSVAFAPGELTLESGEKYRLVSGGDDLTARLWRLDGDGQPLKSAVSGTPLLLLGENLSSFGKINCVTLSPDGQTVAAAGEDKRIYTWNVTENAATPKGRLGEHTAPVNALRFIDDGRLVSAGDDRAVRIWKVEDGTSLQVLTGPVGRVTDLVVHPDSGPAVLVASAGEDGAVHVWEQNATTQAWDLRKTHAAADNFGPITGLSFSPNGQSLLTTHQPTAARFDRPLRILNATTGVLESILVSNKASPTAVTTKKLDSDGDDYSVFTADEDHSAALRRIGGPHATFENQSSLATAHRLGVRFATVEGTTVKVRPLDAGTTQDLPHAATVTAIRFTNLADATGLVTAAGETLAKWNVPIGDGEKTSQPIKSPVGHQATCLAVSLNDQWLVSGGSDSKLVLHALADDMVEPLILGEHAATIIAVEFVGPANDERLISADRTGAIRIWNVERIRRGETNGPEATIELDGGLHAVGALGSTRSILNPANEVTGTTVEVRVFASSAAKLDAVRVRSRTPLALVGVPTSPIDQVTIQANDRVLVDWPGNAANGIYLVGMGPWQRVVDADALATDAFVFVREGENSGGRTVRGKKEVGTDTISFIEVPVNSVIHELAAAGRAGAVIGKKWDPVTETLSDIPVPAAVAVGSLAVAGDGRTIVLVEDKSQAVYRRGKDDAYELQTSRPAGPATQISSLTDDGAWFLQSSEDGSVRLWASATKLGEPSIVAAFGAAESAGDNASSVLTIGENQIGVRLDGLLLTGGFASTSDGGALLVGRSADVRIDGCTFLGNAARNGGAVFFTAEGAPSSIAGSFLAFNTASDPAGVEGLGGAVACRAAGLSLSDNVFYRNTATKAAALLHDAAGGNLSLVRCTFHEPRRLAAVPLIQAGQVQVTIVDSTLAAGTAAAAAALENGARLTLINSVVLGAGNGITSASNPLIENATRCLLDVAHGISPERFQSNYFYASSASAINWTANNTYAAGNIVIPSRGQPGFAYVCTVPGKSGSEETAAWPGKPGGRLGETLPAGSAETPAQWTAIFNLDSTSQFGSFGDYGGVTETLPLSADSIARDADLPGFASPFDQRGIHYRRERTRSDIGSFEYLPLPAAQPDSYQLSNSETNEMSLGEILTNDGSARLGAAVALKANSRFAAVFGSATFVNGELKYQLLPIYHGQQVLARDQFTYTAAFGDLESAPTPITIWITAPLENAGNAAAAHRYVVNSTADEVIPETGPLLFQGTDKRLTLREALYLAAHTQHDDVIEFDKNLFDSSLDVIHLVQELNVPATCRGSIRVKGPGMDKLVIDGGGVRRGFTIDAVTSPDSPLKIELSGLLLRNCRAEKSTVEAAGVSDDGNGAALLVRGTADVTVSRIAFVANIADGTGGAVVKGPGSLAIDHCTFAENWSRSEEGEAAVIVPVDQEVKESIFFKNRRRTTPEIDPNVYLSTDVSPRLVAAPEELNDSSQLPRKWTPSLPVVEKNLVWVEIAGTASFFQVVVAGTTGLTMPDWSAGGEIDDNGVKWIAASAPSRAFGDVRLRRDSLAYNQADQTTLASFDFRGAHAGITDDEIPGPFGDPEVLGAVLHVDHKVLSPARNGADWRTALASLDEALERAAGDYRIRKIKVAGTHTPRYIYDDHSTDGGVKNTFIMLHGLTVEGGYPSVPDGDNDPRNTVTPSDPSSSPTVLSAAAGDVKCANLITARGVRGFMLSRVTISGAQSSDQSGGGLLVDENADGDVDGVHWVKNDAPRGGALALFKGRLRVANSTFEKNGSITTLGGAVYVDEPAAELTLVNSTLVDNEGSDGGAVRVERGSGIFDHLTCVGNSVSDVVGFGGISASATAVVTLKNSLFWSNFNGLVEPADTNIPSTADSKNWVDIDWQALGPPVGELRFNPYQDAKGTIVNGPTPTLALLPHVPFRRGQSWELLVNSAEPRAEAVADQRGAPGTSLLKSDVGAYERRYFFAQTMGSPSSTRFFAVHDGLLNGEQLWGEVLGDQGELEYVQISPHTTEYHKSVDEQGSTPVQAESIVFYTSKSELSDPGETLTKNKATRSKTGFVQRATVYREKTPALKLNQADLYTTPQVKIQLEGQNAVLSVEDASPQWNIGGVNTNQIDVSTRPKQVPVELKIGDRVSKFVLKIK